MEEFNVLKCYVAQFNYDLDDYEQLSVSMSLGNCRAFIENRRTNNPNIEYVIIAVLDE